MSVLNWTAVNANVTIDDWDSILSYPDPSQWQTPNPQSPPLATILGTTPWLDGTYHQTSVVNASIGLSFEGPAIYIFGASGPSYGSYAISIDGVESNYTAYAAANATTPYLLYANANLTYSNHTLVLRNLGAAQASDEGASMLLLDFILATVQLGPAGATITNTTVEDNDLSVKYNGTWTEESNPIFSGGTSIYTDASGASVSLKFNGTALYIFGDTVNNHGPYSVALDDGPPQTYNTILGCEGVIGKTCEKTQPSLKYFVGNLDSREHTVTLANLMNGSFIDLDRFVYTTPSEYAPLPSSNSSASTSSTSSSSTPKVSAAYNSSVLDASPLLLLLLTTFWLLRSTRAYP